SLQRRISRKKRSGPFAADAKSRVEMNANVPVAQPNRSTAAKCSHSHQELGSKAFACASKIRYATRDEQAGADQLNGNIETSASRKVDKHNTNPVRIAGCFLARTMQALGCPGLLLLGRSTTAN
ncbi:hypothetical protein, partial [Bradyrhizobium oropedii]|uniref:hypothetical protein n=1 Tax=Bradyrhizobium oropedii TaxID=1571201 RepID=UPI001E5E9258